MFTKLKTALGYQRKQTAAQRKQSNTAIRRKVVSTLSRGNVSLQRGQYLTKSEIEERFQRVAQHNFM